MTPNEHLLVLFSIILGLGITKLLSSFHDLVHPETKARWHWLPAYWAWSTFSSMVFWWWIMFHFNKLELPNFFGIILVLLSPVLLYLMATSVLPDTAPGATIDLGAFYMANRRRFFGFAAAYTVTVWLQAPVLGWPVQTSAHIWAAAAFIQLLVLTSSTSWNVHTVLSIVNALMFFVSVAVYWFRIA